MTDGEQDEPETSASGAWRAVRSIRFRPAAVDALRGYSSAQLTKDLVAGLVVGIVAVPLAIAFAIASGADPRAGLITAALAGMLVAMFGGSRVQVAGPTGAFVVILYGITQGHGLDKLFVATLMAGALLLLMGLLRAGTLIKFIPYPVTTGFTAGIAVIIFLGQIRHLMGLQIAEQVPGDAIGILDVLGRYIGTLQWPAVAAGLATILIIQTVKRTVPRIPGPFVALFLVTLATLLIPAFHPQTVGDLFPIPQGPPTFHPPDFSFATMKEMFPSALTIALLGAIESLLSAVVADGMIGARHDSNQELMGQGIANLVLPLFGGIAATGAIARTATNVQTGGRTPVASFLHGGVVLIVLVVAAPLVAYVPMAVLGGILAVVAWNMSERHRFAQLLKMPLPDAAVMLTTFALTVLVDLTVAVEVGLVLAAALFIGRMSSLTRFNLDDPERDPLYRRQRSLEGVPVPPGVAIYSIDGPFFFGAADNFSETLQSTGQKPRLVIFRMRRVPYLDATGLNALLLAVQQLQRQGAHVLLSAVQAQPLDIMMRSGFTRHVGDQNICANIDAALRRARELLASGAPGDAKPTSSGTDANT